MIQHAVQGIKVIIDGIAAAFIGSKKIDLVLGIKIGHLFYLDGFNMLAIANNKPCFILGFGLVKLNPPSKHETIVSTERSGDFKLWLGDEK